MVRITFLGGAREIGRAAFLVEGGQERFLLDYGLDVQDLKVPVSPPVELTGVFPSHAHLDHCGMLPELYGHGYRGSVISTPATFDMSLIMLFDSIKVQELNGQTPLFLPSHIEMMDQRNRTVAFREPLEFSTSAVTLFDAGHVPGSSSMLVEIDGKRILYTGDIKFSETRLMGGAFQDYKDIDVVMCDSTYYNKNHPDRKGLEERMKIIIQETVEKDGTAILPAFAVGRTQEMLLIASDLDVPISMDGMGVAVTKAVLGHPDAVKDYGKLKKAFGRARKIGESAERQKAAKEPGVIITTAGMLQGGPVGFYIRKLHKKENCALVLSGFQVPGTVGRTLVETGRYMTEGMDVKPQMRIELLDFSGHCGQDNLMRFLEKVSPAKVLPVHSFETERFAEMLKAEGFEAYGPAVGDVVEV